MWTYNPAVGRDLDKVRLWIGDTDSTDPQLQDEEITFFLLDEGAPIRAAVTAADALAARYARVVSTQIGDQKEDAETMIAHYLALANRLRRKAARTGVLPFAGGISVSDKQTREENTDRVAPAFDRTMQDEPGVAPLITETSPNAPYPY